MNKLKVLLCFTTMVGIAKSLAMCSKASAGFKMSVKLPSKIRRSIGAALGGLRPVVCCIMFLACGLATAQLPDVRIEVLTVNPTSVGPGGAFDLTYRLINDGAAGAGSFTTRFYFSTDVTISTADTYLNHERTLTLAAGARSGDYTVTVNLPADASPGTRYIGGIADFNGALAESDEMDNTRAAAITVTALPDVRIEVLTVNPTSVGPGGAFDLTYRLINDGAAGAGSFTTRFYFSTDVTISTADTYLNHERTLTLAAGARSGDYTVTVNLPADASPGTRYIGGIADFNGALAESDEMDNTRAAAITVTALPDVRIEVLTVNPTSVGPGGAFDLTYRLINDGAAGAGSFTTRFYFSTDVTISTADTYLNHERTLTLAAGARSGDYTVTVNLPADASPGTRYIGGIADFNGALTESDEMDNTRAAAITVTVDDKARITRLLKDAGGGFEIHYTGTVGRTYMLQEAEALTSAWVDVGIAFECQAGTNVVLGTGSTPANFWSLRLVR
jgi:hypothetical protein